MRDQLKILVAPSTLDIHTITTSFVLTNSVNCYLIRTEDGFVMIDTGVANKRRTVEKELEKAGCQPGELALIILTHGDFDHSGNAAYLKRRFDAHITMKQTDSGMVEYGDMLWNRNKQNILVRTIFNLFFRLPRSDRFKSDFFVDEDYVFAKYGFDAKVIALPGHSKGSIGVLTSYGDLFCGDLLTNLKKPEKNTIVDDSGDMDESVEKLKRYQVKTVYPGHGQSFLMDQIM